MSPIAGVPNLWDLMPDDLRWSRLIIIEIKCTRNVMHLSHPKTIPAPVPLPRSMEKLSSMKLVLGAKKVGDFF